ncbi:MAG: MipA/OmpV family protein [Rhizobium sp.]|nr:MAG: MipA/OmpV family protein [Rhizobium sp.]
MLSRFAALLLTIALITPTARADDSAAMPEWMLSAGVPLLAYGDDPIPEWSVTVLASTEMLPRYSGSSSLQVRAYPLVDVRYKDLAFASAIEGIGVNLLHSKTVRAGIAFNYDSGRSPSDAPRLRGTDSLHPAPDAKLFIDYVLFPVVLRADLRHTLGGAPGWVADTSSYVPVYFSEHLLVFCGVSLTWADHAWMNAQYGISSAASAASGLPGYEASAGLRSASIGSDLTWTLNEHWLVNVTASAQRLAAHASNSPLVVNRIEPVSSLSLGYTF